MSIDERSFKKALGCFASGVAVMTAADPAGRPVGVTVSAFASLSLTPPLILFCLDRRTTGLEVFRTGPFAVNILREDQRELSIRFASRRDDKFAGIECRTGTTGVPLLPHCLAALECSTERVADGGDHEIIIGRVEHMEYQTGGQPLLYFRGAYARIES